MIVERIEAAELSAETYRTARRLLDRADENTGHLRMSHQELHKLVQTKADSTARRQLIELQAAGLLIYRRNSDVQIWFADWRPDNVITGDHGRSQVIMSDHHTREMTTTRSPMITDDQPEVSASDRPTREMITTRSNCASGDHLPHTHASAPDLDRQTDRIPSDPICLSVPPPAEEQQRSLRLLRDLAIDTDTALQFVAKHPFERIRHCAAAYWMNRSAEHKPLKSSGIVIHWLNEWPKKPPRTYDEADWRRTDMYRRHRTPEELAADNAPPVPAPERRQPVDAGPPSPYLDRDMVWMAIQQDSRFGELLAGLIRVDTVDGTPCYVLAARDPTRIEWLQRATALRRLVSSAAGQQVLMEIVSPLEGDNTTGLNDPKE